MSPTRRTFITQVGAGAAATLLDADELRAGQAAAAAPSAWDTSWLERLASAQYRVVFNANEVNDGAALYFAAAFYDGYKEAHDTADKDMRPVVVFRRLGTPMAFNDAMWEKYPIGEEAKVDDGDTKKPARYNPFYKPRGGGSADTKIAALTGRGMISLVCNIAVMGWGYTLAEKSKRDVEEVRKDIKANLVPGAILVPSGIYALIRAQNAGCAYMPGA